MAPTWNPSVVSMVGPVGLFLILLARGCSAEEPPRFIKEPKDQIGVSGGVASFVCQATGDPKPRVTWNKKGKKVNSQRFETIDFDESSGAVLRIQPLRTPRDENVYECVAQNSVGEITVHAKLTVLREDQLPPGFPNIDMGPQLKVVERTRTATMLCAASGNPDPEITWFKDFLPVDPSASNGRIKQLRSGALQIESSEETDQGKYECVATNSAGVRYSSPANLYVRVRRVAPRFSILPMSHEIMPGGNVNITCVAVGSPMPYVKWMQGAEDLTPEDDMPVGRNVLELTDVKDSANYTCVAMSSLGVIEAVAQITVKSLPKAPGTPVVTENTATSITVTWDSGNPDPVSYYVIEYKSKSQDGPYQIKEDITTTRYSIGGLSPNSEYEIWVSAVNSIGQGPPSESVVTRTGEQAPASAPRNVQARMLSATTMIVQWEEPVEPNGLIRGYRVYYTMEPEHPVGNWQKHNVDDSLLTTVGSLLEDETYTVRVLAFTSVGDGPLSDPIQVKTQQGVPGLPKASSSVYLLTARCPPPPHSLGRRPHTHCHSSVLIRAAHPKQCPSLLEEKGGQVGGGISTGLHGLWSALAPYSPLRLSVCPVHSLCPPCLHSAHVTSLSLSLCLPTSCGTLCLPASPLSPPLCLCPCPSICSHPIHSQVGRTFDPTTAFVVEDLKPNTEYAFRLAARSPQGLGAFTAVVRQRTLQASPPPPETHNGALVGYSVRYRPLGSEDPDPKEVNNIPPTTTQILLEALEKWTEYRVTAVAYTEVGPGPESSPVVVRTDEDVPSAPPRVGKDSCHAGTPEWSEVAPEQNGVAVCPQEMVITNLQPETAYSITVAAYTMKGDGARSKPKVVVTKGAGRRPPTACSTRPRAVPVILKPISALVTIHLAVSLLELSPKNFKVKMIMKTSVLLSWEFPDNYNSPTPYKIQYNGLTLDVDGRTTKKLITHLKPHTFYNFVLTNRGSSLGGLQQTVTARTAFNMLSGKPSVAPKPDNDGFIVVYLPDGQSPVTVQNYFIVMVPLRKSRGGQFPILLGSPEDMDLEELIQDISRLQRRSLRHSRQLEVPRPYIAARFSILPAVFHPGNQKQYGGFDNRGLEPGHRYVLFVLAVLQKNEPTFAASPFSDPFQLDNPDPQPIVDGEEGLIWVIGPVLAVVFIICIVIAILLYKNKPDSKRKDSEPRTKCLLNNADLAPHHPKDPVEMRRINFQTPGMLSHPPIPIADMAEHMERLKANDSLKLSQEYESIDPGQQFTWEHSNLEANKPKNRYANVIAYDHSRVILQPLEGIMGSDYINANYVDGYRRQNAYIATQGPLPETFGDFWRMVWEQRSATVVMMTRLEEKSRIKCDQYWPNRGTETYGFIQVTLLDTMELATFCVRTFSLHKNGSSEKREVRHFQFTAWPDHGVPEYPTPFLAFLRRVKTCNPPDAGPVVVHCSAGVGRTGCFIVIDAMLERIKTEKTVDVYGHVTLMRSQRNYMVQTEDQYSFIHEALLEAVGCGNTEVPARSLYTYIQKLAQVEPGEHVTGMELEFKRLASSKAHTSRFITASLPCNKFKNRLVNILPYESSRVCLQPIRGVEGSDYINASFIDGYRQQKAYIATQGPLAETTEDFWRALWENNSTIVVMLTKLREMGREKCHQYWPAERSARYQYFVVDPMAEYNMPQYILREFKVTDARDGQSRTVRQFQFTDWPEQGAPKSGEGFIDFIGQVHKTKEQFGQDGPISVHCSAGVGRTGVFITLSIVLERMRYEGVVDIFQTVKVLRTQRPAMVQTEDEYQFCFQAALEYLGSFDHYAT
ncbi:receptor-type tyrosine-protein phosphatase S isoform X1 [Cricetulus griseus]|uniref:receptor-type tyrosine-protein phosphatase S isoform X1 n=1 Tax=Cricetulus griseus TaxID=10029 RepID=UPI0015C38FCB|nr:receptor-type tyrosine-protein phosphatase S isoform X1 [Cricetulus griseus]